MPLTQCNESTDLQLFRKLSRIYQQQWKVRGPFLALLFIPNSIRESLNKKKQFILQKQQENRFTQWLYSLLISTKNVVFYAILFSYEH